jgi:hypothetical protein
MGNERSSLAEITVRHKRDRWMDVIFIVVAVVLIAVSIGSVTSKAAGKTSQKQWGVTYREGPVEIQR